MATALSTWLHPCLAQVLLAEEEQRRKMQLEAAGWRGIAEVEMLPLVHSVASPGHV